MAAATLSPRLERILAIYREGYQSIGLGTPRNEAVLWVLKTFEEEGFSDPAVNGNWVRIIFDDMSKKELS